MEKQYTVFLKQTIVNDTEVSVIACNEFGILYRIYNATVDKIELPIQMQKGPDDLLSIVTKPLTKEMLQSIINEELNPNCIDIIEL